MVNNVLPIELGKIYVSARCERYIGIENIKKSLLQHAAGDWGDCSENDLLDNYKAIKEMGVIRSVYKKNGLRDYYIETNLKTVSTIVIHIRDI